jgi:holo-[acyl-carrier protein] synthase
LESAFKMGCTATIMAGNTARCVDRPFMLVTGVDIIEIDRVRRVADRYGQRFLKRIYTEGEIAYCRGRAPQLASRFAAKEAVMKALGTGVHGVDWRDVEVLRRRGQAPSVKLHGGAQARAKQMGLAHLALSLSHSRDYAVASVVGDSERGNLLPPWA